MKRSEDLQRIARPAGARPIFMPARIAKLDRLNVDFFYVVYVPTHLAVKFVREGKRTGRVDSGAWVVELDVRMREHLMGLTRSCKL